MSTLNCDALYIATGNNGNDFGLLQGWDNQTLGTDESRCFLGGMLAGASILESLEHGMRASKQIEKYLLTGDVHDYTEEYPHENCERLMQVDTLQNQPVIVPASPEGYTKEEAVKEASRCLKCDCSRCMNSCEMLQHFKKSPLKIVKEIYTDSIVLHGLSHKTLTREVAACNMCGQCKSVCPTAVDMGAALLFARRDRVQQDNYPKAFHDYWLRQMEFSINEASVFQLPPDKETCNYLFFPGCQLGSSDPQYVLSSYQKLLDLTGGDTGLMLTCCGAPAYWAGEEERHGQVLSHIRSFWEKSGKGTVICACMTCMKILREYDSDINTVSLYEMLDTVSAPTVDFSGAVFDPCSARDEPETRASIRSLLKKMNVSAEELPFHDESAKCCGWGGHIYPSNPKLFNTIVDNRINAADFPYIVYCSNCRDVFAAKGKSCVHFLDLYFALNDGYRPAPTIKDKHDNSLYLKQAILKAFWDKEYQIPWFQGENMELIITKQLANKLEEMLISQDLLRKAINHAETTGEKFCDINSGLNICSLKDGMCTLWVHYKAAGQNEAYEIVNAYTHRMEILE